MPRLSALWPASPTSPTYDAYRYKQEEELAKKPPQEQHCLRCHATFIKDDGSRCRVPHAYKQKEGWLSEGILCCESMCCGGGARVELRATERDGQAGVAVVAKLDDPYCHDGWEHVTLRTGVRYNGWSFQACRVGKDGRCTAAVVQEPEGGVIFKEDWDARRWGRAAPDLAASLFAPSPVADSPMSPEWQPEMPLTLPYYHGDGSSAPSRL
ncbi:hypothetical protein PsYK624_019710 [Phanerochaete sordida]|uniref:Uncharacterized protein n=1 Tax=Phanerochaete sordida TaxID=48140 RepID=A0A9P3G0J5_9APHY|nr:hypothetical protein PsYK624_019710 [Phanerochaete sordida]